MAEAQHVDVDTGHEYDGIREFDNRLPNWWLMTLWGSFIFGFGYWAYYHTTGAGLSSYDAYLAEVKVADDEQAAAEAALVSSGKASWSDDAGLVALSGDAAAVARGKEAYDVNCIACHKLDGGGLIGPNLTDDAWIHGGAPTAIYKAVSDGVLAKGMPAWKPVLGPAKTADVVAYLLTMKNTNVAGGKAPQGAGTAAPPPSPPQPAVDGAVPSGAAPPAEGAAPEANAAKEG